MIHLLNVTIECDEVRIRTNMAYNPARLVRAHQHIESVLSESAVEPWKKEHVVCVGIVTALREATSLDRDDVQSMFILRTLLLESVAWKLAGISTVTKLAQKKDLTVKILGLQDKMWLDMRFA